MEASVARNATRGTAKARVESRPRGRRNLNAAVSGAVDREFNVVLLLFFSAVAESLSFTKAARTLSIDQSWLSHKIRQFEASLGVNLFTRNTRNVELTKAGLALLEPARRLAEVVQQARAATEMLHTDASGILRVGALPFSFSDPQRTRLLDSFMEENPEVQVNVLNGPTPQLIDYVKAGKVDVAFASGPFDETGLDCLLLRENSFCLLVPDDHRLARLSNITPESLAGVKVVIPSGHFSPAAYDLYYRPVVEAEIVAVRVPEFQSSVGYAVQWGLPVVCTRYATERYRTDRHAIMPLDFVPLCKKYIIRLADHRTPSQMNLWQMAETLAGAN